MGAFLTEMLPGLVLALLVLIALRHEMRVAEVRNEAATWWGQCADRASDLEARVRDLEERLKLGAAGEGR